MTDKQTLFTYRMRQAEETFADARKMLEEKFSPRSILNRTYYSMFYAVLALFLSVGINIKTSKHSGVIAIFDKEVVHKGNIDKRFSKILHKVFDARQEGDYKELVEISAEDAAEFVRLAGDFLTEIKRFIGQFPETPEQQ